MESCTAIELLLEIQKYMLAYIEHAYADYNHDFYLIKMKLMRPLIIWKML